MTIGLVVAALCYLRFAPCGAAKTGQAGANPFRWSGKPRGRRLRAGPYRLVARAVDLSNERSAIARKRFRVLPRRISPY